MSEGNQPTEHRPVVLLVDDERAMLDAFSLRLETYLMWKRPPRPVKRN